MIAGDIGNDVAFFICKEEKILRFNDIQRMFMMR